MALTFITEPQGTPLNAYNNSIVEFTLSQSIEIDVNQASPRKAIISVGGYNFEIGLTEGVFYFNLKEVIENLINFDQFSDTIAVNNGVFVYSDSNLSFETIIDFKVILNDGTEVNESKTYRYIKSVEQVYRKKVNEVADEKLKILSPCNDQNAYLTMFEGYPFDFSLWSDETRIITIKNRRTGMEVQINLLKGVNRIFTTNGVLNYGIQAIMPLYIGVNELEIKIDDVTYVTLFLKKKESECGIYLKWFNQNGSWAYWRFSPIFQNQLKTKMIEEINTDFKNLEKSIGNFAVTGKEAELNQRLNSGYIDRHELKVLDQILTSPKVFLYANQPLEPFQVTDFKVVDVNDGNNVIENNKNTLDEYQIIVRLPKMQTQTL